MDLIERLSKAKVSNPDEVKQKIKDEILSILGSQPAVMQDFKNTRMLSWWSASTGWEKPPRSVKLHRLLAIREKKS
jgi:hypothetical protein